MITPKHLVYVAGPYSQPDPCANTHAACKMGDKLVDIGFIPVIPHSTTMLWHLITPRPAEFWYDYDLHLLAKCDALIRIPGESPGSDREVAFAKSRGIPVFYSIGDLDDWALANQLETLVDDSHLK